MKGRSNDGGFCIFELQQLNWPNLVRHVVKCMRFLDTATLSASFTILKYGMKLSKTVNLGRLLIFDFFAKNSRNASPNYSLCLFKMYELTMKRKIINYVGTGRISLMLSTNVINDELSLMARSTVISSILKL